MPLRITFLPRCDVPIEEETHESCLTAGGVYFCDTNLRDAMSIYPEIKVWGEKFLDKKFGPLREIYITPQCWGCSKISTVLLDPARLEAWRSGQFIQNVWPEKDSNFRELLMTGTHPECWVAMFGNEDESEDERV